MMPTGISRALIEQYFHAAVSRDAAQVAAFLHDDVEWSCGGPVDLLPYCGHHIGKSAVLDTIVRLVPSAIRLTAMEFEEIIIDDDRAATFTRLIGIRAGTGRVVSFRCAQLLRFREGKLIEFRAVIDSFDAAEQMLGHAIEVAETKPMRDADVFVV